MSFFHRLQDSAFTEWFLGSPSIWAYPTVLTLHTVGLAILVGASFVINLRVLQVSGLIPLHRLQPLYRFIWIGFASCGFSANSFTSKPGSTWNSGTGCGRKGVCGFSVTGDASGFGLPSATTPANALVL